jgi:hypothetical protein
VSFRRKPEGNPSVSKTFGCWCTSMTAKLRRTCSRLPLRSTSANSLERLDYLKRNERDLESQIMKLKIFAALIFLAGCASSPAYRSGPNTGSTSDGTATTGTTTTSTYSRDLVECEREAALAQSGSKGKALASCLRARGHTPGR